MGIDATHLHLMLNHVPVLGSVFGLGLLLWGMFRRSDELQRTAIGLFALMAVLTTPVYLSGEEAAEGPVKQLPGVSASIIERHDQAAAIAFTAIFVLGVAALVGLIRFRRKGLPRWFVLLMLLLSLAVAGLMTWTANLGGQIRHTEIRSGVQ